MVCIDERLLVLLQELGFSIVLGQGWLVEVSGVGAFRSGLLVVADKEVLEVVDRLVCNVLHLTNIRIIILLKLITN